jgi:hypothetical protein
MAKKIDQDEQARLESIAYRKKHFAVEIDPSRSGWGSDLTISVTHNGNQWQSLGLSFEEAEKVIATLQNYMRQNNHA